MYYLTSMSDISSSPTSHLNHTAYSLPPSLLRPSRCFDKELLSHSSHSYSTSKLLAHSVCPYFQSMSQVGVSALHHDCYFLRSSYLLSAFTWITTNTSSMDSCFLVSPHFQSTSQVKCYRSFPPCKQPPVPFLFTQNKNEVI